MESMIIPRRYSINYEDLDEEFLDDLEEETQLVLDLCYKDGKTDHKKLLKALERYFRGEYEPLKIKINQPGIFFLLTTYIQLEMFHKAKELYYKIYDNADINHKAIIINTVIHFNSDEEMDRIKLANFISFLFNEEEKNIKNYYFIITSFLASKNLEGFSNMLIHMAISLGVNEETIPIFTELKLMCRNAGVLKDVRGEIRAARDNYGQEVISELYEVM